MSVSGTRTIARKAFNQIEVEIREHVDYMGTKTICVTLSSIAGLYEDSFYVNNPKEVAKELREIADFLETV